MYSSGELFMCSRQGYFDVYFPSYAATRGINIKIRLERAHKQLFTRIQTLFISTHRPHVSLARSTFWWWRHNRLLMMIQWPDNCDASTCKVVSNSLDIDFIHGDIHGRSCKNFEKKTDVIWYEMSLLFNWDGPSSQLKIHLIRMLSNSATNTFTRVYFLFYSFPIISHGDMRSHDTRQWPHSNK